jgi:hypothetical protein
VRIVIGEHAVKISASVNYCTSSLAPYHLLESCLLSLINPSSAVLYSDGFVMGTFMNLWSSVLAWSCQQLKSSDKLELYKHSFDI